MYKISKISQVPHIKGFLHSVATYPGNNALWINDQFYSYEQLWQIVLSIYKKIPSDKNFQQIGVYCNDDVYTYAGILAINLYGAAYVPLNNKFPMVRNRTIIEKCDINLILCSVESNELKALAANVEILSCRIHLAEIMQSPFSSTEIIDGVLHSPNAYILFTSGSTGEPKGVPVTHSNLSHFFNFFLKNYDFNQMDRFLQVYELTFDVSVFSFFMPLSIGACCYAVTNDEIKYIKVMQLLMEHQITVVSMVPGMLNYVDRYLKEIKLDQLRYTFFSGDALYHELAVKWKKSMPNGQIHNFYGPTETTIVTTCYPWLESQSAIESVNGIVPLGKPFDGMHVLIIDEHNQPVEKGELCFAGPQVITNYLHNSNEKCFFYQNGRHYYKTGDVASINSNGNLLFHGRTDSRVKINGYRIELVEIEFALHQITNTNCIAVCSKDEKQLNKLIAFIETENLNELKLKASLASLLPHYMIPQQYVAVNKFPVNSNQKTDKQALLKYI